MTDEVAELLTALSDGSITLDEVAHRFRERKWPRRRRIEVTSYSEMAAAELEDPAPYVPGSFDDVAAAYHQHKITRDQFQVLSEAAAEAQRSEDAGQL